MKLRRKFYNENYNLNLNKIDYKNYDYNKIYNRNCENVIGIIKLPLGLVGPVNINKKNHIIPISTTEGALVGSINNGYKIISECSDGINFIVSDKGITRAPILELNSINEIPEFEDFLLKNLAKLKTVFESTTNYGKLIDINTKYNGNKCHLRFQATTGDAMGMNMISKGADVVISYILSNYPHYKL